MPGDKYVIGLTGNIATGKSVVARMLERLGAKVIDADRLVHWLLDNDKALQQAVVREFGEDILDKDGRIIRRKLAAKVFGKPEALKKLEALIHPRVIKWVQWLIENAKERVIVVEAIKLVEAGMHSRYDALWVVTCPEEEQLRRLVEIRGMTPQEAIARLKSQPPQEAKLALADVIIYNDGPLSRTWEQVKAQWEKIMASLKPEEEKAPRVTLVARKAYRKDLPAFARFLSISEEEALEKLLQKGYIIALQDEEAVGILGWNAENLVASIEEVIIKNQDLAALGAMLKALESEASALMCEVAIVALPPQSPMTKAFESYGYTPAELEKLYRPWREEAQKILREGQTLLIKRIRETIITQPI